MLIDTHIHTMFSGDSSEPPEKQVEQAIRLGMPEICFTDHHDYGVICDTDYTLDFASYFPYMQELRDRYADRIAIRIGVELGLQCRIWDYLEQLPGQFPFDYIIGSSHFVDGVDPYLPEFWEGKEEKAAVRRYFEVTLARLQSLSCFDACGHLDYIIRYGKNQNRNYHWEDHRELIEEILLLLIRRDIALECNTGGFRYGLGQPNPCIPVLKRYRELGGELLTIGSDAHDCSKLGIGFAQMEEALKELGFRSYLTFAARKPVGHLL